jgi:hypothetical protein
MVFQCREAQNGDHPVRFPLGVSFFPDLQGFLRFKELLV